MPYYLIKTKFGLDYVGSEGDGTNIKLKWYEAFPTTQTNSIAYNIYYSTTEDGVFFEPPKYVSVDNIFQKTFLDFVPGQLYYFAIRPIEYNSLIYDYNLLVDAGNGLKAYQQTFLKNNITADDLVIPVDDVTGFPSFGTLKIGYELIEYSSVDTLTNTFNVSLRGARNTIAKMHNTDGYDGSLKLDPTVMYYLADDDSKFDKVMICQSRFEYPKFSFTQTDGYKQVTKDLLYTDLSISDEQNIDFPSYSYVGWHRTDPSKLIAGECIGSYIGGYQFCADGYANVGTMIRNISMQDANNQRQEMLLEQTGEPVVLLRKQTTGIVCTCYQPSSEYHDDRCSYSFGTKFVLGYDQYFNPRRSDGRILVRFSPGEDDVKVYEAGLESEFNTECWTLTVPTIKDRDVIVRYDLADNEEYRYEVLSVTRQRTFLRQEGGQKFRVQRIRKTDPVYQIRVFKNTSKIPETISTSFSFSNGIPLHKHDFVINEGAISNMSQLTSISQGHNHLITYNSATGKLEVSEVLGHKHEIII